MKREELTALNVPEDAVDKIMAINGADIEKFKSENEKLKTKLDTTTTDLTAQLTAANETVADLTGKMEKMQKSGEDVEGIKAELAKAIESSVQANAAAEQAKKDAADRITAMEYDNAVNGYVGALKFTSEYAKRGFIEDFKAKGFKLEDGKFLGADDYVKGVQEKDPATFVPADGTPKLKVTDKGDGAPPENTDPKDLRGALAQKYNVKG